eukprot:2711976-Alexandrium_andersonii.AAC.1
MPHQAGRSARCSGQSSSAGRRVKGGTGRQQVRNRRGCRTACKEPIIELGCTRAEHCGRSAEKFVRGNPEAPPRGAAHFD